MNDKKPNPFGGLDAYRKTDVITANKETILLMMYSGAIRFLKRAIDADSKGNIEEKTKFLDKTQQILIELRSTLNFDIDKNFASTMDGLYNYMSKKLTIGTLENKPEYFAEVLSQLMTLNESWEKAVETLRKERTEQAQVTTSK